MSVKSLLSIEKTRKECFVMLGGVSCFGVIVRSSLYSRWKDLMEYMVWLLVTFENKRSSRDENIDFILG